MARRQIHKTHVIKPKTDTLSPAKLSSENSALSHTESLAVLKEAGAHLDEHPQALTNWSGYAIPSGDLRQCVS